MIMRRLWTCFLVLLVAGLQACGIGESGPAGTSLFPQTQRAATLSLALSSESISSSSPASVTATLIDAAGRGIPGSVVAFSVAGGLGRTNVLTALTDATGQAKVMLSPSAPGNAGADEITASATVGGTAVQSSKGFAINATAVNASFDPLPGGFQIAEYGRASLTLRLEGASVLAPVNLSLTSSCVSQGKASISPATVTANATTVAVQYTDLGCGALQANDPIQATVTGTGLIANLTMPLSRPGVSSLAFIKAVPELIYLKGSGLGESSVLTFEVRDASGNPLGNQTVSLALLTGAGGIRMEGLAVGQTFTATSNASGQVSVRVNAGTVPTPVRVSASIDLGGGVAVSTVSSNLSIGVGLPAQANFSLSQGTFNIEGANIDGIRNTYSVIASDRNGNPVPTGTAVNFVTESGQIESSRQIQVVDGLARTTVNFQSGGTRPTDGRVTVTAYMLGEESFIDLNGNNTYDAGEPFQDLGDLFKDRNFDGIFDAQFDEVIPLAQGGGTQVCQAAPGIYDGLLNITPGIPSRGGSTCDGGWSGAGRVYVRRSVETVLSTSTASLFWRGISGLTNTCANVESRADAPNGAALIARTPVAGDTWFGGADSGSVFFLVADTNGFRWNPMPAGTTITVGTPTEGLTVNLVGAVVPSTTRPTIASLTYAFANPGPATGVINIQIRSPGGTLTSYAIGVARAAVAPGAACPNAEPPN